MKYRLPAKSFGALGVGEAAGEARGTQAALHSVRLANGTVPAQPPHVNDLHDCAGGDRGRNCCATNCCQFVRERKVDLEA